MDHFSHFFKEYLCAETKEIKRKAFCEISSNLPPLDKHVFKGINCATHLLVPGTSVFFRVSFHFQRSPEIVYCFVFLSNGSSK